MHVPSLDPAVPSGQSCDASQRLVEVDNISAHMALTCDLREMYSLGRILISAAND